ncbi:MAG: DUF4434 domain-containing protein [Acidimicrobiales bacterium]
MRLIAALMSLLCWAGTAVALENTSASALTNSTGTACHATMGASFLPPSFAASWSLSRYGQDLSDMKAVGINTVILQETVDLDANLAYFPVSAGGFPQAPNVTGDLIYEAAVHGSKVMLGLTNANDWAVNAGNYTWLSYQLVTDEHLADRLYSLYRGWFSGWYIPNEVDDYLLSAPSEVTPTTWFFNTLTQYLHTHDGAMSVMAAPFYQNTWQTTAQYAAGVAQMFAKVDIVNLQDGAGEGRSAANVATLFSAVAAAMAGHHPQLWDDPDMYRMGVGPMPPGQLQSNLQAACGAAVSWSGFSFSSQMEPLGVGTSTYYSSYAAYKAA